MSIAVNWDNKEKTIIRFVYSGVWTWDEFYAVIQDGNNLINTVSHPVVSIVDMSESTHIPPNSFSHMKRIIEISQKENNTNISVFLNSKSMIQLMNDIVMKIYPGLKGKATFHYADTLEEARQKAASIQAQLVLQNKNTS